MPEVSVIIPVYNAEKYIKRTIDSVLNQTYNDFEIIVIDDGSTDNSKKILDEYKDKVRYFYQNNSGVSSARNNAIKLSSGKYIALLDQDDLWYPQKLEIQINYLKEHPDTALLYSDCNYIDENDNINFRLFEKNKSYQGNVFKELIIDNFIPIPTVLIKKEVLEKVGLFLENYTFAEEHELYIRIAKDHKIGYIDEPLAGYRVHDSNLSKQIDRSIKEDISVKEDVLAKYASEIEPYKNEVLKKLAEYHYHLGIIYRSAGHNKKARESFKISIKISLFSLKQIIFLFLSYF